MSAVETLPDLRVELDGAELTPAVKASLSSLYIAQRLSMPALCELTFSASAPDRDDLARYSSGSPIRIAVGGEALFQGTVTALEHGYEPDNQFRLRLRGYDRLYALRKRQPVRAHVGVTVGDLAREIVADLGLAVRIDDEGPTWRRVMQWRQSDLELLREVAARSGLYFSLHADEIQFVSLAGTGEAVELELGHELLEASFDASLAPACTAVDVRAWDPWEAAAHEATETGPRTAATGAIDSLAREIEGDAAAVTLVDRIAQSDSEAAAYARAELDDRRAREIVVRGVAAGDPGLRPGRRIEIGGVASPLEGRYVLTEVVHTIDRKRGYRSEFDSSPSPPPPPARGAVSTLGIVTDVGDPDDLGRIRVTLPSYCDIETDWLAVVMPGGGPGKGLVALPDVGDHVLLILPREDPAQGLVLGGLYGRETPPSRAGVDGGHVRSFSYVLPGGQRLHMDQDKDTVRLENGGDVYIQLSPGNARLANNRGSYVELASDYVRIHANADLEFEAPGRSVVFRSAKFDFQTG